MKIIIKIFIILFVILNNIFFTYADTSSWTEHITKVEVVEKVPWRNCKKDEKSWYYVCEIKSWFSSVNDIVWEMIKYITLLTLLRAILFIVISGIMMSMAWADSALKDESKKRIVQWIIWLILVLLSWIILNIIAPWIYK